MNLIKRYWLVVVLVFLIAVLFFFKIRYSNISDNETKNTQTNQTNETQGLNNSIDNNQNNLTENSSQNTSNITPMKTINETKKNTENTPITSEEEIENYGDYKTDNLSDTVSVDDLSSLLPYQGKYFRVEKYLKSGYLEVIVKDDDNLNKATEELENWLKDNNTDSQETQIIYVFK